MEIFIFFNIIKFLVSSSFGNRSIDKIYVNGSTRKKFDRLLPWRKIFFYIPIKNIKIQFYDTFNDELFNSYFLVFYLTLKNPQVYNTVCYYTTFLIIIFPNTNRGMNYLT